MSPPRNPFLDPDTNQPLPPTPPTPPVPPRSTSRPPTPLPCGASPPPATNNPFLDPSNIIPETSASGNAKSTGWSNNPYHANVMSGTNNGENPTIKKPASSTSTKSGFSSLVSGPTTTLVSRVPPFAPSYPPGHDVNKPSTSTYTIANPFVNPQPTPESYKPKPPVSKNGSSRSLRSSVGTSVRDFAPSTTTASTPGLSKTIQHIQSTKSVHKLSPRNSIPHKLRTKQEIDKEIKLKETARRQNYLLELERLKTIANLYPEIPRLHPSPRVIQGGINRDISTGSASGLILNAEIVPPRKLGIVRNPTFWIFFTLMQFGLISTGAAFAVLLTHKGPAKSIKIGTAMVFWLVCSIAAAVIGIIGSLCIWGRNKHYCGMILRKAGLEEMGLLPNYGRRESSVARGFREREEEDRRVLDRLARVGERERERLGSRGDSMSSITTIDPIWQALYETPEEARNRLRKEMRGGKAMEMEIRAGVEVMKKRIIGAETMLSGGSELRNFNELDIGTQTLTPTPLPPTTTTVDEFINQHHATFSQHHTPARKNSTTNPRFPFSKYNHKPTATTPTERQKHYTDRQKAQKLIIPSSSPANAKKTLTNSQTSTSTSPVFPLSPEQSPYISTYTLNPQLPIVSSLPVSLNNSDTALETYSPLENLARELNTPELRSLSVQDRHGYFVSRRSENEERGRKVRQSLERASVSVIGGNGNGNGNGNGVERKPTIMRTTLKPIVSERVQDIEKRSLSQGREKIVLTKNGSLKVGSSSEKGKSLGSLVMGRKSSPIGSLYDGKKTQPQPDTGVFIVGESE